MTTTSEYGAIIVGSGQAGNPLAKALAKAGHKTALIERVHVGGSCVNVGCTPTKTLWNSARVAYLARRAADYGVRTAPTSVDMVAVRARKQGLVDSFRDGGQRGLEGTEGVELIFGQARFADSRAVEVRTQNGELRRLTAKWIFINTGMRPLLPPIEGLQDAGYLTSTTIMELDTLPEHLLVVGGGYVALEFGQIFRRFGSKVTVLERGPRLAPREDEDVSEEVAKIFREDGIDVLLNASARSVRRETDGSLTLTVSSPSGERQLPGSHLLLAAGRRPNTDDLNLAAAGVTTDEHGYVIANERLETNAPGVYALGDIKGGPAFTHISYDDFRVIRANLLEGGDATIEGRYVPSVVYMDPQLGRVGLNEREARAENRSFRVAKMPMSWVARALEMSETRGFMKALVDIETKQILGCTILGIEGGELMSMVEIAMMGQLPYTVLREAIFAHPTLAESLNNLFATLDG